MRTELLPTCTPELFEVAVDRAARTLQAGDVVAIPTETVYGLAANALDPLAVRRIFEIKGRPSTNPLIVHVASLELARQCALEWTTDAERLASAFWPGPLTIVLPRSAIVPGIVTASGPTVAIRWPRHPFVQQLIMRCGFPLAAPSANPSGRVSPTTAQHVLAALDGKIPLVVDGGPANVGIESTVVDLARETPGILRPGMIHADSIASVLGKTVRDYSRTASAGHRSPGMMTKHYAPKARLLVLAWTDLRDLLAQLAEGGLDPSTTHVLAHSRIPTGENIGRVSVIPHDPEAFARALYGELHRADEMGAAAIVVEQLPDEPQWKAIMDRLSRAAARE